VTPRRRTDGGVAAPFWWASILAGERKREGIQSPYKVQAREKGWGVVRVGGGGESWGEGAPSLLGSFIGD